MERRLITMFKDMMKEQDSRNAVRITAMEASLRTEMAAIGNRDEARIVSMDEAGAGGGAPGATTGGAAAGPLLKVPATTLPPPKLEFGQNPAKFDAWHASWTAYLETSGVKSIADAWARQNRERSLLQQAFEEDMATWVMRQNWYRDPSINNYAARVLERIREKIDQEADPRTALAALMRRQWTAGESVDSFWLDIQTQVQYCGLRDEYHTDLILTTVWANNFGDDDTRKEFALNPKWTAAQCYQKAKGLEQVRKERGNGIAAGIVNAVRQSSYKKGGGKSGGGGGTSAAKKPGGGGNPGRKAGPGPRGVRAASCLNCGFDTHRGGVCPAQGQPCKACGTVGHYAKHCPVHDANAVIVEDNEVRVCNALQATSWSDEVDAASEDDRAATLAVANSKKPAGTGPD
jgi:hypothetical protein